MGDQKAEKKALKEEKKRQKMEKFLAKKTAAITVTKPKTDYKTKGYDPISIETKWYNYWMENDLFKPKEGQEKFVIPIPPPNVTGNLHIGHAMMVAIQDTICRYKRMKGFEVLYVPGTDHAGIATQTVVMKQLDKEGIKVDREGFLEKAWEWKNKHGSKIYEQFERLGTSVDFSRERFTLDPGMSKAVNEAFVRLHEKNLIYREPKIVNWCGKLLTTISDLEVNHEEIKPNTKIEVDGKKYEFGVLYHFKYPISDSESIQYKDLDKLPFVEIATTRPETILGDTAICINPKDERYSQEKLSEIFNRPELKNIKDLTKLVGFWAVNPLTGKKIPIIKDEHADLEFGTGVLKVTPAHDPDDFELARKHNLEIEVILDEKNFITFDGQFKSLKRFEAREKVIAYLSELNLFVKKVGHTQMLPRCSRSGDIIEPMIKSQWWLKCNNMAEKAIKSVTESRIKIHPVEAEKHWFRWLENIRDWCLSRQLWWGHRIPAYKTPDDSWFVGRTKEEAFEKYKKTNPKTNYVIEDFVQDEDVLDTWFSSGLWPFAILGWPDNTQDLNKYYPASLLETGNDILFFWVARMVMLGLELTNVEPFSEILLHGIVRDAHGRKMSKSLGNVIDPIFVIDGCSLEKLITVMKNGNLDKKEVSRAEAMLKKDFPNGIPRCGADALRFTLLSYTSGMKDINLDILRVEGYRRLCNKIWNAAKFVKMTIDNFIKSNNVLENEISKKNYSDFIVPVSKLVSLCNTESIHWILNQRNETIKAIDSALSDYNFMAATKSIHQYFLYDFCDVFIEVAKSQSSNDYMSVLLTVFIDCMKMFHPFMPFISEEIFSNFFDSSISISEFPKADGALHENNFTSILKIVKSARAHVEASNISKAKLEIVCGENISKNDLVAISSLCRKIVDVLPVENISNEAHKLLDDEFEVGILKID